MAKTILYFADGTWNGEQTGMKAHQFLESEEAPFSPNTNVHKLFLWLDGDPFMTARYGPGLHSWTKVYPAGAAGPVEQIAMYCHGVGDNKLIPTERVLGGIVGAGLTTRLRLGYTFISKHYEPGDRIVIVGFSRGAYTARALADLIVNQGLLRRDLADDGNQWLSWSAAAWLRYRRNQVHGMTHPGLLAKIQLLSADLHRNMIRRKLEDSDFVEVDSLAAVVVWDTVGALGVPYFQGNLSQDVFDFDATDLHPKIEFAVHAVSLDEQRLSFQPTLWNSSDRLVQELFPGGHADVGGGYVEHDLSDVPFLWAKEKLTSKVRLALRQRDLGFNVNPNLLGQGHREWTKVPSRFRALRRFPHGAVTANPALCERRNAISVLAEASVEEKYAPENLPTGACG